MMKNRTLFVAGLVAIPAFAMLAGAATSDYCQFQDTTGSFHCFSQYDTSSDALSVRLSCDQTQQRAAIACPADGHFDFGGVIYDGGRSPNHHNNGGNPDRDLPASPGTFFDEKVYANDAVFGQNVGVFWCEDVDGNGLCGEGNASGKSEPAVFFCGHTDLGSVDTSSFVWAGYYVVGPVFQQQDCGGSLTTATNPIGGTWGTISIWLTPIPQPPRPDENNDGVSYGAWGGVS